MTSRLKLKRKKSRPPNEEVEDNTKSSQVLNEIKHQTMFERASNRIRMPQIFQGAIASAQKHRINLKPGKENIGGGNCSYESVIFNINERSCFTQKLPMSQDYYRIPAWRRRGHSLTACNTSPPTESKMADRVWK